MTFLEFKNKLYLYRLPIHLQHIIIIQNIMIIMTTTVVMKINRGKDIIKYDSTSMRKASNCNKSLKCN